MPVSGGSTVCGGTDTPGRARGGVVVAAAALADVLLVVAVTELPATALTARNSAPLPPPSRAGEVALLLSGALCTRGRRSAGDAAPLSLVT